jgi:phenylalanyl-tRNA synthetase beta chain
LSIVSQIKDTLGVHVLSPQDCPRYVGRVIRNIRLDAVTPVWIQERLRRSGIRSIHPIVDINNYVMMELGQPLHAFDLSTIVGEIIVRQSSKAEQVKLLDEQTLVLDEPALVIADTEKILALAGIMGGAASGVTAATTDIFIESAYFTPQAIRPTVQRFLLQSDAAYRFERGVDPQLALRAMHRVSALVLSIAGGEPGPLIECVDETHLPKARAILLRRNSIQRLLGVTMSDQQVTHILESLGMKLGANPQGWEVTAPSYRFDIEIEADLLEELARVYGYDALPSHHIAAPLVMLPAPEEKLSTAQIRQLWVDKGYHEAINYSFVDAQTLQLLDPQANALKLQNPISSEMAVMRTSLWPGLLQAVAYNLNRQATRARLFEMGVCFLTEGDVLRQEAKIAAVAVGQCFPEQWGLKNRNVDFFDLKGDVESLLDLTGGRQDYILVRTTHPALHPGRAADVLKQGRVIGSIGELHPQIQRQLNIDLPVYLFELFLAEILETELPHYRAASKFPSIRRDLAFIIPEQVSYQEIQDKIKDCAKEALQNVRLFDIYQGQGIQTGQRSVALGLTFQLASRTLIDQEVDSVIDHIITTFKLDFQEVLRD